MVVFSILFSILKIILWGIAIVLGIVMALLLIILFSPICYDVTITTGNVLSDPTAISGEATIFWLWRLLKITVVRQNNATKTKIIFLGKCFVGKEKKEPKSKKKTRRKKTVETPPPKAPEIKEPPTQPPEPKPTPMETSLPKEEDGSAKTTTQEHKNTKREKNKVREEEKTQEETEDGIVEKLLSYKARFQHYYDHPDRSILLKTGWKMTKKVLLSLKPRVFYLRGVLGLSDVSVTGSIMAAVAALSGVIGADIFVQGTLEEKYLSVVNVTKGRIVLMSVLAPVVQFLCTKPMLKIIWHRYFKKDKKQEELFE